jgi:hypothetical protein
MNQFTQHIPNFVDTRSDPPSFEFETTEELLSNPIVQKYRDDNFESFALSGHHLMVIGDAGFFWWVVGYIKDPADIDLPIWKGGPHRAILPNGQKVILSPEEVRSICSDEIRLSNGGFAWKLTKEEYES